MAETKKTEAAAAAAPPEAACLTLRQKLVEMRKACPEIVKKQHSDGVSYKYAKIYDVWEKITPIMNELGVDFDVISEQATRHAENGDPVYWITMQTKTRNGDKLMFLYEADLTIRWLNLDNDDETIEATVHAVGWNDDPAKAKGAAHTYALKYYLFEKFGIDQGEDDPDMKTSREQRRLSRHSHRPKIRAQRLRTARRVEIPSRQGNPPQTGKQGLRNRSPTPSSPVCTGRARTWATPSSRSTTGSGRNTDNKIPTC